MDKVNLPLEKACEPDEEAKQPVVNEQKVGVDKGQHNETFAESTVDNAQYNSAYKNLLSQPPKDLTHKEKLLWLQKRRTEGLWVQCDDCNRWRHLPQVLDSHELSTKWFCWMNPDSSLATCSAPEVSICLHDEEDLIHAEYAAGSVVLARMPGFPWWPAMVDDCPDTEQYYWLDGFSDIPTHYNVVFFDAFDVSRAWIAPDHLLPYKNNKKTLSKSFKIRKYKNRLNEALAQANDALKLTLAARLAKYSFIARFEGKIITPKKINKKLKEKYQSKMKRKFHVDFCTESTDSEDEVGARTRKVKVNRKNTNKNTIEKSQKTETIENSTNYLIKDLNSLTVQLDSNSALIQKVFSEASNNCIEEQGINKFNSCVAESMESLDDSQKSDDFDFYN